MKNSLSTDPCRGVGPPSPTLYPPVGCRVSPHEQSVSTTQVKPARVKSPRFFPGWIMLGFSAAAQFMSAPGQSYSVSAFKEPMRQTLGISETNVSFAYAVATVVSGLVLPWTGRMVDRFGARVVLPTAAGLLSVACYIMSRATDVPTLYVGFMENEAGSQVADQGWQSQGAAGESAGQGNQDDNRVEHV